MELFVNIKYKIKLKVFILFICFVPFSEVKKSDRRNWSTLSGMQCVEEYGMLFHRIPEKAAEQKKVVSVLNCWVIGYVYKKWYKFRNIKLQLLRGSFFQIVLFSDYFASSFNLIVWISIVLWREITLWSR